MLETRQLFTQRPRGQRLTGGFCGEKTGARQATVSAALASGQRQGASSEPMSRRHPLPSALPGAARLGAARPVISSSGGVGRRHGGQPGCCVRLHSEQSSSTASFTSTDTNTGKMNGQSSPVFEEKKPLLPALRSSISATKDSPTLPESSSTDVGFYSSHGSQDFYPAQQPYSAQIQHMNPYSYHPYTLNGMGPGGGYSVGKTEYQYPPAAYRESGAFSRELQDSGELAGGKSWRRCE